MVPTGGRGGNGRYAHLCRRPRGPPAVGVGGLDSRPAGRPLHPPVAPRPWRGRPPLSRTASAPAPAAADRDGHDDTRLRPIPQVIGGEPTEDPRLIRSLARLFHPPRGGGAPPYFCAGVLVTERHLLTAAHCATAPGDSVALGSAAMYGGFNRSVVKVTAHPSSVAPAYTMADIAVVEFAAPASAAAARKSLEDAGVGPAALTLDPAMPGVNLSVVLAGWGPTTEAGIAKGIAAQPLMAVTMRTWEPLDCHTFHDQVLKDVPADQFCAGGGGSAAARATAGARWSCCARRRRRCWWWGSWRGPCPCLTGRARCSRRSCRHASARTSGGSRGWSARPS
ncbi:hypothetical protein BU14_0335s0019 [Porphyra umbilicalis]|uniref:Peptidase S1 domain-containing protein n=1 Tax=Porphyra umbilicalis TaxID=2786 RepID=A0A1X6NYF2_PORUM|nr:hypothetical protein BU14_0335s0019 [Porphyra umbilicalis]|eukprot:OSX73597.1 hypothetical protein BU14_0335s0019 [Porphyra umbilicalis]